MKSTIAASHTLMCAHDASPPSTRLLIPPFYDDDNRNHLFKLCAASDNVGVPSMLPHTHTLESGTNEEDEVTATIAVVAQQQQRLTASSRSSFYASLFHSVRGLEVQVLQRCTLL